MTTDDNYQSIRIPKEVIKKLDDFLKEHPEYNSRLELIKEALRMHIKEK